MNKEDTILNLAKENNGIITTKEVVNKNISGNSLEGLGTIYCHEKEKMLYFY